MNEPRPVKRATLVGCLLTPTQRRALRPVDERSFRAGMVGVVEAGLYRPGKAR